MHDPRSYDGTPDDREPPELVRDWRSWALILLVCAFVAAWAASCQSKRAADDARVAAAKAHAASVRAAQAVEHVRKVEIQDRNASRSTAYRLCSRGATDRAFAHSRVRKTRGPAAERRLEDPRVLPIFDCRPNLKGQGAAALTPSQQRRFRRRWEQLELTGPERGLCPGSRIGQPVSPKHC